MSFKTLAVLALSAVAFAHPHKHHHFHHGTGTGGVAMPTGGAFEMPNNTEFGSETTGALVTATVVPLEAMSSPAFAGSSVVAPVGVADVDTTSSSCSSSTFTSTYTSMQFFTETVSAGGESVANVASPTTMVPTTMVPTTMAVSSTPVLAVEQLSTSSAASGAPGAFFQHSSFGGLHSSVAAVPTSFMTVATSAAGGVPSLTSSAAMATATGSTGGSSSSTGKKGLSYNTASLTDAFAGKGITWAYNWGSSAGGTILAGVEYVPMLWGASSVAGWSSAASSAIASGSQYLLSFNEPDLGSQSNLLPAAAAALHIANMNPFSGQAKIVSPAVTNGAGSSIGIGWLQQFFDACAGQCKVDVVAGHWYADASAIDDFKSHVQSLISTASANGVSEVWMTEFGTTGGDEATFMAEAVSFLDSTAGVGRYAAFMCGDGTLLSGTSLSAAGLAYAG